MTPPTGAPDDPIPRRAARVLLLDAAGRVLMFKGYDPSRPDVGYWFTVGGALDDGETPAMAAARELREETGLTATPAQLGEPVWHQVTDFPFDGRWYRQDQDFFLLHGSLLHGDDAWEISCDGFDEVERRSIERHAWWSPEELEATTEKYYPDELPALLRSLAVS